MEAMASLFMTTSFVQAWPANPDRFPQAGSYIVSLPSLKAYNYADRDRVYPVVVINDSNTYEVLAVATQDLTRVNAAQEWQLFE